MSSFFFSASITLVLLSILPLSTAYLVDTDRDPIYNGRAYYIIPINNPSGLTYTQKNNQYCPLYITPEKTENSPGTPVQIFSDGGSRFIELNQHVSLSFKGPTPCGSHLEWNQTLDNTNLAQKLYITAGKDDSRIYGRNPFSITKWDKSLIPIYELKYRSSGEKESYNVGLYEDDGLLGITEYPTKVSFKKAFNVLELSTS